MEYLLLLAWICVAVIPAVFSEAPYPKRCATLFPALMLAAGIAYSHAFLIVNQQMSRLANLPFRIFFYGSLVFATCLSSAQWFSGFSVANEIPLEEQIIRSVSRSLKPKNCIAILTTDNYAPGKFSYLLADSFSDQSLAALGLAISVTESLPIDFNFDQLRHNCSETLQDPLPFYRLWGPTGDQQIKHIEDNNWSSLIVIIGPIMSQDRDRYLQEIFDQLSQVENHFFDSTTDARQYLVLIKN